MFKESFKYYKSRKPPPDLSGVINISAENVNVEVLKTRNCDYDYQHICGLIPAVEWEIFQIKNKPGLIFIKNPFTTFGQRYWICRCLRDFSKKPNKLNIDAHNYLQQEENWWEVCTTDKQRGYTLFNKLRWATLGYHHDWDTKVYSESSKEVFPDDLANLCKYFANVIGFSNFNAESAIINYYHMNSTLSGHTDHSEENLDAPLFSFSFGQSAIFLIGGLTEDDPALPIIINSGDVIIMSKESRLCYHAVPKILTAFSQPWNKFENELNLKYECKCDLYSNWKNEDWDPFSDYVEKSRINMNVRQVLRPGQLKLTES